MEQAPKGALATLALTLSKKKPPGTPAARLLGVGEAVQGLAQVIGDGSILSVLETPDSCDFHCLIWRTLMNARETLK